MKLPFKIETKVICVEPVEFQNDFKTTIIYGINGSGKTTLSECLRIKDNSNPYKPREINLGAWQDKKIYVYNRHFVNKNVHNGIEGSDINNLISGIVLGESLIKSHDDIKRLQKEYRDINQALLTKKGDISEKENQKNEILNKIKAKLGENWQSISTLSLDKANIQKDKLVQQINISASPVSPKIGEYAELKERINYEAASILLQRTVQPISPEKEAELLKFCEFIESGRGWIKTGLKAAEKTEGCCPFCKQDITNSVTAQVIDDYKKILLTEDSKQFEKELRDFVISLNHYKDIVISLSDNDKKATKDEYKEYPLEIKTEFLTEAIKKVIDIFNTKIQNFSQQLEESEISNLKKITETYIQNITSQNARIQLYNQKIEKEMKDRDELLQKRNEIEKEIKFYDIWISQNIECKTLLDNLSQKDSDIQNAKKEKDNLERRKEEIDKILIDKSNEYQKIAENEVKKYAEQINKFLKNFNAEFKIRTNCDVFTDRRSKDKMGEVSAQYQILRNEKDEEIDLKQLDYALSEGEKNLLGLAFFLATLPKNLSNDVIVFDDPMTSFDVDRNRKTIELLRDTDPHHLIILTHNKTFATGVYFFKECNVNCGELKQHPTKHTKKTIIIHQKNGTDPQGNKITRFIEKDQLFELYERVLQNRAEKNYKDLMSNLRKLVELIYSTARMISKADAEDFNREYELTRLNASNSGGKKQSIWDKNFLPELYTLYDSLSYDDHSSNSSTIELTEKEQQQCTEDVFNKIQLYFKGELNKKG